MPYLYFFFVIILLFSASPVGADDAILIKAPAESATVKMESAYRPPLVIEGWVCGSSGADAGQSAADMAYRLRLAEQGFKNASAGLKTAFEARKKAVKAPVAFKGLSLAEASNIIDNSIKRFPKKIQTLNADLNLLKNKLSNSLKEPPNRFFGVDFSKKALQENHLNDNLRLAAWEDDGAYQVWTTNDCYSEGELKSMQSSVAQALEAAEAARDELLKTASQISDGQGAAFTLPR